MAAEPGGNVIGWGAFEREDMAIPNYLTNIVSVVTVSRHAIALTADGRVLGWGDNVNDFGAVVPPPGLTNVVKVQTGAQHSLALTRNGLVTAWGGNPEQIKPPSGLSNVVDISAGAFFSLALTGDGQVRGWGNLSVPASLTNAMAIGAGYYHGLAVLSNGTVVAWGDNTFGQCNVPPGLTGVIAVTGGSAHSVALKNDGTVVSWGTSNGQDYGQTNAPASATNIVSISAGSLHNVALKADGAAISWGWNGFGQLNIPEQYTNLLSAVGGNICSFGITRLPVTMTQPADVQVLAGTNASFHVEVMDSAPVSYQWFFNDTALPGETSSSLTLTNVQVSDSGEVSVRVSNSYGGVTSSTAHLVVVAFPPIITVPPPDQRVLRHETATISVTAIGASPLAYQWYLNNRPVPGATNESLIFTDASNRYEGLYNVVITNIYGGVLSRQVWLLVDYPPVITNEPANVSFPAGSSTVLNAGVEGDLPIRFQWLFEGGSLPLATNKSIVLTNIGPAQAGNYSLIASNEFGVVTNSIYNVTITDSPPVIYEQPISQPFQPGGTTTLRTAAYGTPPLAFQWWHGNTPVPNGTNVALVFTNINEADAGIYFVSVTNVLGSVTSASATLSPGVPYEGEVDWPSAGIIPVTTNVFKYPTCIANAGDGSGRLFILQQTGRVQVIRNDTVLPDAFLDITNRMATGSERGLLGIVFPPGFSNKGHFYVDYTRISDGATVISRFKLSSNPDIADPDSEEVLKVIEQPFPNHNGGQLAFGPDGYLYIGMGDGGYASYNFDPFNNAQNPAALLGKLLRIDVENGVSPYAIPASNPFITKTNYAPEIWSLGLRNPWRFSFDRKTGDLYIGDVGHNTYEEIDFQKAGSPGGQNYGWRVVEGPYVLRYPPVIDLATVTDPIVYYSHQEGASVTGGYVYRGPGVQRMDGVYFFGDFINGKIWVLKQRGTNWLRQELIDTPYSISTFGEDEQGRIHFADYTSGRIFRLEDSRETTRPRFTPERGILIDGRVQVNSDTPGAIIHYTTDGRDPTEADPGVVSGSFINVSGAFPAKLRAYRPDLNPGPITSVQFALVVATPVMNPSAQAIIDGTTVTITCDTPGAEIRYSLDGMPPDLTSPIYTGPLVLNGNTVLSAVAIRDGFQTSQVMAQYYPYVPVAAPVFTPPSRVITNGTIITITCDTPETTIYYTTDGTDPTADSIRYQAPFPLNGNTTLKAIAFRDKYGPSPITAEYFDRVTVAEPEFNPPSGPLTKNTLVTITSATPDAIIHYTLDGSEPGESSPVYSGPVLVRGNITLSARASKPEYNPSPIHTVRYDDLRSDATVVWTLAGNGVPGTNGGYGEIASFNSPEGVWLNEKSGELFVSDTGNNKIRKILPNGQVVTVAGTGEPGFAEGTALTAQFNAPSGICGNTNGDLFIADRNNQHRIRKINAAGEVSTLAIVRPEYLGAGLWQMEIDAEGNLYVGDWSLVFKVSPDGGVREIAGSVNSGEIYGWSFPVGIAVDSGRNIFATTLDKVVKILPDGQTIDPYIGSVAGSADGISSEAKFTATRDAAMDSAGNLFISEIGRVRRFGPDGVVNTYAGTGELGFRNGKGPQAMFNQAAGICADALGNVYVADSANHRIRVISPDWDADGIPDFKEKSTPPFVVGIDDQITDSDHDGMSNAAEFLAGTDPLDAGSFLSIESLRLETDGKAVIQWKSTLGKSYIVKYSDDLVTWNVLGGPISGNGTTVSVADQAPLQTSKHRTYRVFLAGY